MNLFMSHVPRNIAKHIFGRRPLELKTLLFLCLCFCLGSFFFCLENRKTDPFSREEQSE